MTAAICDKAWHGSNTVPAVHILTCSECGKIYARCVACNKHSNVRTSMQAHFDKHRTKWAMRERKIRDAGEQ